MSLILAVSFCQLADNLKAQGLHKVNDPINSVMNRGAWFGPRADLELDEYFRQVIPYIVLQQGDRIATYRRAGTEKRLDGKYSIGFGGHVELRDLCHGLNGIDWNRTLENTADRELREELTGVVGATTDIRDIGVLVDDSTPVSRVHVGIVQVWSLWVGAALHSNERGVCDLQMMTLNQLEGLDAQGKLETWSSMVLPCLS